MQKVFAPIQRVRFTLSSIRQASIPDKKGPSLGKTPKILISEVPTLGNLTTGPMKRLKDNSDAPEARHGILPNICTSSKKKTRLHSTFPRRNGYSRLRQQKSRKKESFVVDSGASMHMVSKKDLNSAELETMRTSRSRRR